MNLTYTGRRRADQNKPSYLEVRGLLATPGYVGIRHAEEAPRKRRGPRLSVTETDTLVLGTVA